MLNVLHLQREHRESLEVVNNFGPKKMLYVGGNTDEGRLIQN